jgi:hypothetical protein
MLGAHGLVRPPSSGGAQQRPVAVVPIWYHLAFRRHDWAFTRTAWAVVVIIPSANAGIQLALLS